MATCPIDAYALRKKLIDKYGLRLDLDGQEVLKGDIAEIRKMPALKGYHNSKLSIKNRVIGGDAGCVAVYGDMMRFQVQGTYTAVPEGAEEKAENRRMRIERYDDGSADVTVQSLVKWDTSDTDLEQMYEDTLNHIEEVLGIPDDCLSSSSWNAGHNVPYWDALLTDAERKVVKEETL